jgi:uncharacterized protein YegL
MTRLFAALAAAAVVCIASFTTTQGQVSSNITASVLAPASIQCSDPFSSSIGLTGFDVQDPGVADIMLVLDESGSINAQNFQREREFAADIVNALMTGPGGARVGIVQFSGNARLTLPLTDNVAQAVNAANTLTQRLGATCIGCGIDLARQRFLAQPRPEATKFMIVLTDGANTVGSSPTIPAAVNAAEAIGVTLLAIGIGNVVPSEIEAIASDVPGVETSFLINDFEDLPSILAQLTAAIVSPGATNVTVNVDVMPRFPVTGASATAGTVQVMGNSVAWSLPSLGSAGQTLTLQHQHDGTGNGPLQVFSATYSDAEAQVVVIDEAFTSVTGCNTAPVANAGVDQTVPLVVGSTVAVTLDGSGSTDDGLVQPLNYSWASDTGFVAGGVSPTVDVPFGIHVFTLTVNDGEFSDSDTVVIDVIDAAPPVIDSVTPSASSLWPPNHAMTAITLDVSATDAVSAATCTITNVTSSEPDNGLGDGDTANDIVITGPLSVDLRSERSGKGPGRTYTIEVTCTDAAGNPATSSATVFVPKSNGR